MLVLNTIVNIVNHSCASPALTRENICCKRSVWHFLNTSLMLFHQSGSLMFSFLTFTVPRLAFTGENIYSYLNSHLSVMTNSCSAVDLLGSSLHVWPDFHGNRSPLADPTLKGMVRGLKSRLDMTYFRKEKD